MAKNGLQTIKESLYENSEATEVSYQDLQCTKKKNLRFYSGGRRLTLRIAAKWSTISTHTQLPNFEIGGGMYTVYDTHSYMSYYIKLVLPPPQTGAVLIPMIGIDLRGWLFTRGPSGGFHNVNSNPSILMKEITIRTVCKRLSLIIFGYFSFSKC
jgi:hypothetical protein